MTEAKPEYSHGGARPGAGRPSLEKIYGEPIIEMTIRLPESYYIHVSSFDKAAADYIRDLVAADMTRPKPDADMPD